MTIVKRATFFRVTLAVLIACFVSSCNQSKINIDNIKKKVSNDGGSTAKSITVSNVDVTNNQLVIDGVNLDTATSVRVTGPAGFDETFAIESQSNSQLIANSLSNLTMVVNGLFSLIVSNAHGAATYSLTFELQDGQVTAAKLNNMGAVAGEVLTYNGTSWGPAPLTGLSYQGTFDATGGDQTSGAAAAGHYYIVTNAGSNDPDGLNNGNTYTVGDWAVYNGSTSQWDVVIGSNAVVSVAGKVGAVTLSWADFSKAGSLLSEISNVDVSGRADGDILVWNNTTSNWEVGQRTTDTNTNAITECGAGQVLLGDGSCSTYVADTNASTICADGQYLDGDGTCYAVPVDTNTTYTNGTGLLLSGTTFSVDVGTGANQIVRLDGSGALPAVDGSALTNISASSIAVQNITSGVGNYFGYQPNGGACNNGEVLEWNGAQGWVCGTKTVDNDTTYSAGAGLNLAGTTFSIPAQGVTNTMVNGVTANCSSGEVLKANGTGGFSCATDVGGAGDADANKLQGENLDSALAANTTTDGQILVWSETNGQWQVGTLPADSDTTYTAGTGLALTGTIFSVNPDTTATLGTSDTEVPSQNAVKTYVDAQVGAINESQWITSGSDIYYNTGVVGVGTTTPTAGYVLDAAGDVFIQGNIRRSLDTGVDMADGDINIRVNNRSALRGTRAGAVAVTIGDSLDATGTVTVKNDSTFEKNVEVKGTDVSNTLSIINESSTSARIPSFKVQNYTGGNGGYPAIDLTNARGSSGTPAATNAADPAGLFQFWGHDGSASQRIGSIGAYTEATTTGTSSPGFLQFNTTSTSSVVPSEKMRITGAGNVGINETTPNEKLTIDGAISLREGTAPTASGDYGKIYVDSTDSKLYFVDDAGTSFDLTATGTGADNLGNHTATQNIDLGTNKLVGNGGTNGVAINASGNVGIGNTNPLSTLHVSGGGRFVGSDLLIYRTNAGGSQVKAFLNLNSPTSGTRLGSFALGDGNEENVELNAVATETHAIGTNYGTAFLIKTTENTTTTAVERLRVDHDGKVGIGTTTPAVELDVNTGVINASAICDENNANCLDLSAGITSGDASYGSSASSPADAVYVNDSGFVGVGTTAPAVPFQVNGDIALSNEIFFDPSPSDLTNSAKIIGGTNLLNIAQCTNADCSSGQNFMTFKPTEVYTTLNFGLDDFTPDAPFELSSNGITGSTPLFMISSNDETDGDYVTITKDGKVGLGTKTPSENLVVGDDFGVDYTGKRLVVGDTTGYPGVIVGNDDNNRAWQIWDVVNDVYYFGTRVAGANYNNTLVLDAGKVGIGTASPAVALDVDTGVVNASAICDENNANCIDLSAGVGGSDNLGDHTATQNLQLGTNYISNNGTANQGLTFDSTNRATFKPNGGWGVTVDSGNFRILNTAGSWATGIGQYINMGIFGGATRIYSKDGNNAYPMELEASTFKIQNDTKDTLTIDSSGNVGIGLSDPTEQLATEGDGVQSTMGMNTYREASSGSKFIFRQSRGSRSAKTASQAGDYSNISFRAYDGSTFGDAAEIRGGSDSTASAGSTPGRLRFYTTPSGSTTAAERMVIDSAGLVGIRNTNPSSDLVIGESIGAGYAVTADSSSQYGAIVQTRQATPSNAAALWIRTTPDNGTTTNTLFRVENNGLVGVNRANPASTLDVNGTIRAVEICDETGANCSDVSAGLGGSSGDASYASSASSPNDAVYVNDSGFVGIGTTTPGVALHIKSSEGLRVERTGSAGFLQLESDVANPTGSSVGLLDFIGLDSAANRTAYSSIIGGAESHTDTAENGFLTLRTSKNGTMTERVRVTSDGKVGIGTNAPTSFLHLTEPDDTWNSSFRMDRSYDSSTDYFQMMYDYEGFKVRTMANGADEAHLIFKPLNVEAMRITQSGNVGIGTSTPAVALDVNTGVINASAICDENNANCLDLSAGISGGDPSYGSSASSPNDAIFVNDSGNVGIGTVSPSQGLQVTNGPVLIGNNLSGTSGTQALWINSSSSRASVTLMHSGTGNTQTSDGLDISQVFGRAEFNNRENDDMVFLTNNTEIMRLEPTGNVGIGTSSPSSKLEVVDGAVVAKMNPTNKVRSGLMSQNDTNDYVQLEMRASDDAGSFFGTSLAGNGYLRASGTNNPSLLLGTTGTAPIIFGTSDLERMQIDSSGNVGIGRTPASKLDVNGTVRAVELCDEAGANCTDLSAGIGGSDNLGNHTATQNIDLATFKLVGNGGTNGLTIDSSGNFNFGTGSVGLKVGPSANTTGSSWGALAGGFNSNATSISTFAFGSNVTASNWYAFASGEGTTAAGRASVAMGEDITVNGSNSIGFGLAQNGTPPVVADSNTMAIMGGEVGIGTVSPTQALEVVGTVKATSFVGDGAGLTNLPADNLGNHTATQNIDLATFKLVGNGGTNGLVLDNEGNVGVGVASPYNDAFRTVLEVGGTSSGSKIRLSDSDGDYNEIWSDQFGHFNLGINGTVAFVSKGTNNGFGAVNPQSLMHLHNSTIPELQLTNTTTGSQSGDGTLVKLSSNDLIIQNQEAAGAVKVSTSGATDALFIEETGNVGIGTSTPSQKLQVSGGMARVDKGSTGESLILTGTGSNLQVDHDGTSAVGIRNSGGGGINFKDSTNSNIRVHITNSGNVGIGSNTTNVTGSNANSTVLTISGDGTLDSADGRIELNNPRASGSLTTSSTAGRIFFTADNNGPSANENIMARIFALLEGSGGANGFGSSLIFHTRGDNTAGGSNERMRINNEGNVGIGTTAPTAKLQVARGGTPTAPMAYFDDNAAAHNNSDVVVEAFRPGYVLRDETTSAHDFRLGLDSNAVLFSFDTNNDEAKTASSHYDDQVTMKVQSNGKVAIGGDITPLETLHIYNNAGTEGTNGIFIQDPSAGGTNGGSIYYDDRGGLEGFKVAVSNASTETGYIYLGRDTGRVGIATGSPVSTFHVNDGPVMTGGWRRVATFSALHPAIQLKGSSQENSSAWIELDDATTTAGMSFRVGGTSDDLATATRAMTIRNSGNVGIGTVAPTALLSVNGTANKPGGGSWATFSDARLKDVTGSFERGLSSIRELSPIRYNYKEGNGAGIEDTYSQHIGFIAQDVEQVIPEAVSETSIGYLEVNNDPIIWTMFNGIKELDVLFGKEVQKNVAMFERMQGLESQVKENSRAIASLKEKVEVLEEENKALKEENAKLEERLKKIEAHLGL